MTDSGFLALQSALAGEYSLERELGRGGMGVVYLAREVRLERPVAIKVLPPELASRADLRERFLREARTAASLSHPNIVQIFRVDELRDFVFIVMAYIDGGTFGHRVRTQGPRPADEVARVIRDVSWALGYAHLNGVVHRDIKPDNILLDRASGRALVTDFGIADPIGADGTAQLAMGTPHFMSPEQATGSMVDGRSDLYSLGIVGYYALTGELPFDAPSASALLTLHVVQPAPPVAAGAVGVPDHLARAVDKLLMKHPEDRFPTSEALAAAIDTQQVQRRLLPAPMRVWIQKKPYALLLSAWFGVAFGLPLAFSHPIAGWMVMLSPTLVSLVGAVIYQTRRLFRAGYAYEDALIALREHLEQRSEELRFEMRPPTALGRFFRTVSYGGFALIALSTIASAVVSFRFEYEHPLLLKLMYGSFSAGIAAGLGGGVAGLFFPGRSVTTDSWTKWRLRFWQSRIGRFTARLAELGLRNRQTPAELGHRPTELSVGIAAMDLFRALPRADRRELQAIPELIKRLERDAQNIRKRMETLASRIDQGAAATASAHLSETPEIAERQREAVAALREEREVAERELADAVAALENIRLDLLRLHSGRATISDLTAALEAARAVRADIDATVDARRSVEALLASE